MFARGRGEVGESGVGGGLAFPRRTSGDGAEEVFAGQGKKHGAAESPHLVEVAQHRHGLGGRLGEIRSRVEDDRLGVEPARDGHIDAVLQELHHVCCDVEVEVGVLKPYLRPGTGVHQRVRNCALYG